MANVQQHLQQLGYYKGRVDGIWGPRSRQALSQFQRDKGMQATGQLDDSTMQALNSGSAMNSTTSTGASTSSSMGSSDIGRSSSDSRFNSLNSPRAPSNANSSDTSSSAAGSGNPNAANSTAVQPAR
jgi:peptidoglycan hydrolase-like protein with peptidoglycan-binding domain